MRVRAEVRRKINKNKINVNIKKKKKNMVECFCGRWTLQDNQCFDEFLTYYKYPWYKRKLALLASIDLVITDKTVNGVPDSSVTYKVVFTLNRRSTFLTVKSVKMMNIFQNHRLSTEGEIVSQITNGDDIAFMDTITVQDGVLTVTKHWQDENGSHTCPNVYSNSVLKDGHKI